MKGQCTLTSFLLPPTTRKENNNLLLDSDDATNDQSMGQVMNSTVSLCHSLPTRPTLDIGSGPHHNTNNESVLIIQIIDTHSWMQS